MTMDVKIKSGLMLAAVLIIATKIVLFVAERYVEYRSKQPVNLYRRMKQRRERKTYTGFAL